VYNIQIVNWPIPDTSDTPQLVKNSMASLIRYIRFHAINLPFSTALFSNLICYRTGRRGRRLPSSPTNNMRKQPTANCLLYKIHLAPTILNQNMNQYSRTDWAVSGRHSNWLRAGQPRGHNSSPGGGQDFSVLHAVQTGPGAHRLLANGYRGGGGLSPELKRPGRDAE
jgi:hypothetical protein